MEIEFKKNYKFWLIILASFIIIALLAFYDIKLNNIGYVASFNPTVNAEKYNKKYEAQEVGNEIKQKFVAKYNNLKRILVQFDELNVQNSIMLSAGKGTIGLQDENGKILYEEPINVPVLKLNCDYKLSFPTIENSEGKTYYVFVRCDELVEDRDFFSVLYSSEDLYENGELYINQEKVEGDMYFQEMYSNSGIVLKITIYMFMIMIILSLVAIIIYYHKKLTPEKLFWTLIPAICIMFLVLMPAFKSHDEGFHWFRIQDIAQGNLLTNIQNNKPIAELKDNVFRVTALEPEIINYKYVIDALKNDVGDKEKIQYVELATTSIYNPVQYIPQTLGVIVTKMITDNAMIAAYIARIINLIVAICILYLAIKKMPIGKIGLLISMCFPIAIEGFTSLSPDAITISISYLFIAYVFNMIFGDKPERYATIKDSIILFVLAVILALCKIVYLPIVRIIITIN